MNKYIIHIIQHTYAMSNVSPIEIDERSAVQGELSQAVRTEGEEHLPGLDDAAVRHLVPVGVPAR